jgi:hypothetical protein
LLKTKEDQRTTGVKWNTLVINAVVIFVGEQAITQILGKVAILTFKVLLKKSFSNKLQIPTPSLTTPSWTFIRSDHFAFSPSVSKIPEPRRQLGYRRKIHVLERDREPVAISKCSHVVLHGSYASSFRRIRRNSSRADLSVSINSAELKD